MTPHTAEIYSRITLPIIQRGEMIAIYDADMRKIIYLVTRDGLAMLMRAPS